jgi:hypothetical protein
LKACLIVVAGSPCVVVARRHGVEVEETGFVARCNVCKAPQIIVEASDPRLK